MNIRALTPEPGGDRAPGTYRKIPRTGLNRLAKLRAVLVWARRQWLVRVFGMDIHPTAQISLSARLDRTYPRGVHVGAKTYVAFHAAILTHDRTRGLYTDTVIGQNCFVGAGSMILPGIRIGDGAIVGAGAVVTRDVPTRSMVAGNPARIVRREVDTVSYGRLRSADATEDLIAAALNGT